MSTKSFSKRVQALAATRGTTSTALATESLHPLTTSRPQASWDAQWNQMWPAQWNQMWPSQWNQASSVISTGNREVDPHKR